MALENYNSDDILRQPLWYNDKIKIGQKVVCYKHWKNKGIRYVNDLVKGNGTFLTRREFEDMYEIESNLTEYYGMIDCIQRSFKKNEFQHKLQNNENACKLKLKEGTRQVYSKLVLENNFKESYKLKWQVIMEKEYDKKEWH